MILFPKKNDGNEESDADLSEEKRMKVFYGNEQC